MLRAISITVREGFEAASVIGIMLTHAVKTSRTYLTRPVLAGMVAAIAASAPVVLGLRQPALRPPVTEGVMYIVAALFVLSMVVWMWREVVDCATRRRLAFTVPASGSSAASWGVAAAAFFMVVREGIETVLFMSANALDRLHADGLDIRGDAEAVEQADPESHYSQV